MMAGVLLAGLAIALWWSNRQEKAKEGKPASDAPPTTRTVLPSKRLMRALRSPVRRGS